MTDPDQLAELANDIAGGCGDDREGWYGAAEALALAHGYRTLLAELSLVRAVNFTGGEKIASLEAERDALLVERDRERETTRAALAAAIVLERERDEALSALKDEMKWDMGGVPEPEWKRRARVAEARVCDLEAALRHYADESNWQETTVLGGNTAGYLSFDYDGGHEHPWKVARDALAAGEPAPEPCPTCNGTREVWLGSQPYGSPGQSYAPCPECGEPAPEGCCEFNVFSSAVCPKCGRRGGESAPKETPLTDFDIATADTVMGFHAYVVDERELDPPRPYNDTTNPEELDSEHRGPVEWETP
jgi:hypothetical protein